MSPRVSREHMKQRRADIMEAATRIFIKHGYEHTTMKHIMEEAGISRGGLYQYFSNKEDLFEALLEEGLTEEAGTAGVSLEKVESHWMLLMQLIFGEDGHPDTRMDPLAPSKLEFFITGRNDERRRSYGEKRYELVLSIYNEIIKAGQETGEFSDRYDSELLARSIITFVDGLALDHAILSEKKVRLEDQSVLFVDYLKMALGVSSS
ncbi:putative HTH-type transcriptional regulator YfiR [Halobacillus karajensis]|uniref:HTH-type transcriptional regulator YfiR n=2 Tax=Halobacillus karajensis TaxID=195088 RepID=A0A059NXE5_9BACI|nr:putative HTH-type transcriptional regulator YfiR [Halobacillus karajensis]CDQ23450.1 putative HTH-type transcriptional regulator YfiR [Halobacillus karajensis]CDQ26932.1 putative HTH-type transcriptional regulator YfiR [Halobacillus karajensis]